MTCSRAKLSPMICIFLNILQVPPGFFLPVLFILCNWQHQQPVAVRTGNGMRPICTLRASSHMSPTRYMCTAAFHSPASMKWYSASDSLDSASSSCRDGGGGSSEEEGASAECDFLPTMQFCCCCCCGGSSSVPWPGAGGSPSAGRGDAWPPGGSRRRTCGSSCTW